MENKTFRPRTKRQVLLLLGVYRAAHHHGIARYAREARWALDGLYTHGRVPTWWRGDGMITLITTPRDYAALQLLPKVPLVDMSKGWITNAMPVNLRRSGYGRPRVLYDNAAIGRLAAEHFLERGFRHIAFFNFGNWWMETERIPFFRKAIESAGAKSHAIPYYRYFSMMRPSPPEEEEDALQWLVTALRALPKPIGIFAATDDLALTMLRACNTADISVPEEVAVLGCDNEALTCDFAQVPLSSVDPDSEQQGYEAAKLLDRLMDGAPAPRKPIIIPPKGVVTRQSTDILAIPHLPVARALRYICEHYTKPIRTSDIAAAVGLSLRGLELAFKKYLHRSLVTEINRRRIEHAKDLLIKTNMKTYQIAEQSGFNDMAYFSNVFFSFAGVRPSRFRKQHNPGT